MDLMACVDAPAFPLQLLLGRHPEWKGHPVVVVDKDKPQGIIQWANMEARCHRILPGMRYAAGLALSSDLRAGVVDEDAIAQGVNLLADLLRRFSPDVEPAADEPGVFWLNASGLERLFGNLQEWASGIRTELDAAGFGAHVTVGFSRFGTYAIAKAGIGASREQAPFRARRAPRRRGRGEYKTETIVLETGGPSGARPPASAPPMPPEPPHRPPAKPDGRLPPVSQHVVVFLDPEEERAAARGVPLECLGVEPDLRDTLDRLGVRTVGAFLDLPATGIRRRFGKRAYELHKLATGELWAPLSPQAPVEPIVEHVDLDDAESNAERLLFLVKRMLTPLLAALAARHEALTVLIIDMKLDGPPPRTERIKLAEPTLDARQILNLVHLRLEGMELIAGVTELQLSVESVRATVEQLRLFVEQPKRDLASARRAFARIRAELGNDTIVVARLREGHLPEASFTWESLETLDLAQPLPVEGDRPMVRRVFQRSLRLPPRPRHEPDGWLLRGEEHGHVVKFIGPYVISGGWWVAPVHREYHFAELRGGELMWIYYDRRRRRWFWQGQVE